MNNKQKTLRKTIAIFMAFVLAFGVASQGGLAPITYAVDEVSETAAEQETAPDEQRTASASAHMVPFTTPVNETTAVVYTFAELQTAVTGNVYSLVYLGADINMSSNISWPVGRKDLIIDGTPPSDLLDNGGLPVEGAGEQHTLTSTAYINVTNSASNNNHALTFRNMQINQSGNSNGLVVVANFANLADFRVVLEGVTGSGRSFVTAPYSQFELRDSTINMVRTGAIPAAPGKVASANRVILGGTVKVIKGLESDVITYTDGIIPTSWIGPTSSAAPLFEMDGAGLISAAMTSSALRIEAGADVLIDDRRAGHNDLSGIIQNFTSLTNNVDVIVGQEAKFVALTRTSFDNRYDAGINSFVVEKDAYALVAAETLSRANNSLIDIYASINTAEFRVEEGGSAYIIVKKSVLVDTEGFALYLSRGHLRLNNPRALVSYSGPTAYFQTFNVWEDAGQLRRMELDNIRGASIYAASSTNQLGDFQNVLDSNGNFVYNHVSSPATKLWALNGRDENDSGFAVNGIFAGTYLGGDNLNITSRVTTYPSTNTLLSATAYGTALPAIDNGTGANGMTFKGARVVEIYGNYSKKPIVDTPLATTTGLVSGKGVPGAQIVVHVPDQPPQRTTVATDGTWSIDIAEALAAGFITDDTISVTQREVSVYGTLNDESEPVSAVAAYTITEQYVDENGTPIPGRDDTQTYVRFTNPVYTKTAPATPDDYVYIGHKIGSFSGETIDGSTAEIDPVTGNTTVYFVYQDAETLLNVSVPVKLMFASFASGGGTVISPSYEITNRSLLPVKVSLGAFQSNDLAGITLVQATPANERELQLNLVGDTNFSTINSLPDGTLGASGYMGQLGGLGSGTATGRFTIGGRYYGSLATPKKPQFTALFTFELVVPVTP